MKHNSRIEPGCLAMVIKSQMGNSGKVVTVESKYTAFTPFDDGAGNFGKSGTAVAGDGWLCAGDITVAKDYRNPKNVIRTVFTEDYLMRLDDPDMEKTIETEKNKEKEHG